jgi:NitT/TauT family transport system permease protein
MTAVSGFRRASVARWLVIAGFVLILEILCRTGVIAAQTMIPPSDMVAALYQMVMAGDLNGDALVTFQNVGAAFVIAVASGFAAGIVIHALPRLRRVLEPLFASYYAVPTFVFYPVLLAVLGMGNAPMIAIGTLFGVVAMIVATLNGLDRIPPVLVKTARVMGMSVFATAFRVQLPAIAPYLFTGVKLAIAYAFIGVIAAEFILSGHGLGYAISYAYNNFDNRTMYADMLLIILIVSFINAIFQEWERRILRRRGL